MEGILHNTPFALAITDNQGRINIINNVFESLFGYSKDEIYNQTLEFICPEGSPAELQKGYYVSKRRRKDGSLVEVEIFTEPNMMGAQQLGFLVFYNDITTRLKAESELQKTREEYLEVLDYLRDGYVETDQNGVIVYANLPFIRELDFDHREDLIGKHFWELTQKEFASGITSKFNSIYETKEPLDHFKTRYEGKDGRTFVGEAAFSPVFKEGEVVGIKGTIRNVTKRIEAEKELAIQKDFLDALLEQTPIAVVNVGKDNKISFVNPAFHELFGYSHEESLGQNLDYLLAPPGALDEMGEYSKNRMGERLYITGIRKKKDGSMTDVVMVAHPFFVGSINYGHLVFYIDISERLKAEAELESTTTANKAIRPGLSPM
jgi:PAS domain S-box-containing protein